MFGHNMLSCPDHCMHSVVSCLHPKPMCLDFDLYTTLVINSMVIVCIGVKRKFYGFIVVYKYTLDNIRQEYSMCSYITW